MTRWLTIPSRVAASVRDWARSKTAILRDRLRGRITVRVVTEEPARAARRHLYVSWRAGRPAVGWLRCPCGCGDVISLRLAGQRSPRWTVDRLAGPATLHPSVWRKSRCESHFVLRDGRVLWS